MGGLCSYLGFGGRGQFQTESAPLRSGAILVQFSEFSCRNGFPRKAPQSGRRDALAINSQTGARVRAYLDAAGHADSDGSLFRPLKHNGKRQDRRRRMDPHAIDRVVRKNAVALGLDRGYSAHSMRATFITTALENGAQLEDVQKAAGHRDPSTTKLYDRRGYNPEKAASFFATY
jgi:integrase/recombinase XerD